MAILSRAGRVLTDISTPSTASTGYPFPKISEIGDILRRGDIMLAVGVMAILVVLIIPLPAILLDFALAISITGSILILQRMSHDPAVRRQTPRAWAKALAIGFCSSLVTHLVFQELFLVRMP